MYYVYLLKSLESGKCYVGLTSDLKRRLKEHLDNKVWTTSRMGEIKLVFYEAFLSDDDARRRERYLKTTKGRSTLRLMLRESLK